MSEVAQERFRNDRRMQYILRLGFGILGGNRYCHRFNNSLNHIPEARVFFDRIEQMINSNDMLDIRVIRLLIDFIAQ